MWNLVKRMPPPHVPYALVAKWPFQMGKPRVIHIPEARVPYYRSCGWIAIAADSDVPLELQPGQTYDADFFAKVANHRPPETQEDGA